MQAFVEALDRLGNAWAALTVAVVWQSTLVALVVAAAAYALARSSPAVRYWLWQIVAIKLLIVPLWAIPVALPWLPARATPLPADKLPADKRVAASADGELPLRVAATRVARNTAAPRPATPARPAGAWEELSWRGWLFVGWGAVVLLQIGRLGVQRIRLARLLRGTVAGEDHLLAAVERIAAALELKRPPRVVTSEADFSPFVCGIVRPTLVLPRELAAALTAAQLDQVIAHELAHVKRRDLVWGWLPQLARVLYFFHPVAYLADYRIRLERELACDQAAMHVAGGAPGEYADTLVRVLSAASRPTIFRTSAAAPLDGGLAPSARSEDRP